MIDWPIFWFLGTTTATTATTAATATTTTAATATTTTATATTTTTQNPQVASLNTTNTSPGTWTQATYSYLPTISANLTLTFGFQTNDKDTWYLDDVSVKDPTSVEMLTNGDFESSPLLTGWTTGSTGSCTGQFGISNAQSNSPTHSYYDTCDGQTTWISQSFSAIGGQVYNVTFWYYYYYHNGGNGSPVQFTVNINWGILIDFELWYKYN